jgi:perosamine synthetase
MTNLQAALGVGQMERIDEILAAKKRIAQSYNKALADIDWIELPPQSFWSENVFWLYSIILQENSQFTRDELSEYLSEQGIETRPLFPCIHNQPIYNSNQFLPVAELLSQQGLSLPSYITITDKHLSFVISTIKKMDK